MPDLPTLTVTDAQANRILLAFGGQVDEAGAALTPVQAYRRWLRESVRNHVLLVEGQKLDQQHNEAKRTALERLRGELP
jgi:hypothetical protein